MEICAIHHEGTVSTLIAENATQIIFNTYCFSTATVVTRTNLKVTCQYIACLVVYILSDGFFQMDRHCGAYVSLRAEFFFLKLPASVQELGWTCYSSLFCTTTPNCIRYEYCRFSVAVYISSGGNGKYRIPGKGICLFYTYCIYECLLPHLCNQDIHNSCNCCHIYCN